ncbi:MAG TPA: triose-phosphate isomerase [Spirochaetia bacterium]|nr:MAG: triose-phosphate isomerase [Spirochaetes bacterium GWB1_36_13]HCL57037.1 triose-phosphate isomerase [Spirochaetia bacterium]
MKQRKKFFGANWKMYKNMKDAEIFFQSALSLKWEKETVFFPPTHLLASLQEKFSKDFKIGAQNCYFEKEGAFTGEISYQMLLDEKINYALIGHSERRLIFKESDELLCKKASVCLSNGLKVIFCVGETLEEREKGKEFEIVENQIKNGLKGIKVDNSSDLIIAYEPVWAIGTGKTATPEDAEKMHAFIRKILQENGFESEFIRIIYGGSVKPENIKELMKQPNIDGGLVGGASLKPESFIQIVNY